MKKFISWQTQPGESLAVADVRLIPQSQVLQIRLPFVGFVWNRPTGITVERNGRTETFPLIDVTRLALWGIFSLTVLVYFLVFINNRR